MSLFSIFIIVSIVLLGVFLVMYWTNALYVTFNKITPAQQKDIENYVSLLSKKEKPLKCRQRYSGDYSDLYINNLKPWKDHEKELVKATIRKIQDENVFFKNNEVLRNCPNKKLEWNLLKTKNLELDLPCTISNLILLPKGSCELTSVKDTLIHEQMHLLQRNNQDYFNNQYKKLFGEYIKPVLKKDIKYNIPHTIITNPDEDKYAWIIKEKEEYYIVPYIYKKGGFVSTKTAFKIDDNLVVTKKSRPTNTLAYCKHLKRETGEILNCAHPNETFVDYFMATEN